MTRFKAVFDNEPILKPNSRAGITIPCTDGRVVTGGTVSAYGIGNKSSVVLTSKPASDGSGFVSLVQNPDILNNARLTQGALCIARPAGYSIVQDSKMLNPRERAFIDVACPAGSVVIGGGASTETGVYLAMSAPKLDGSAWSTYFRSDAIIGTKKAEAWAVCAASTAVAGREIVASAPVQLSAGMKLKSEVSCPAGKLPLSVGPHVNATTVYQGQLYWHPRRPQPDGQYRDAWWTEFENTSGALDNVTLEARLVVICATASY